MDDQANDGRKDQHGRKDRDRPLDRGAQQTGTATGGELRSLVLPSVLAGLCPLIPIPFLDDWARDLLRRRAAADLCRRHGLRMPSDGILALTGGGRSPDMAGCLRSLVLGPILYLLRKIFRKVFFFLTVKDCVDTTSRCFHETYLIRHALSAGRLAGEPASAGRVHVAIGTACAETDPRPIERTIGAAFRGSRRALLAAAERLGSFVSSARRNPDPVLAADGDLPMREEEEILGGMVDELSESLAREAGYLGRLAARFDRHLAKAEPPLELPIRPDSQDVSS